MFKIVRRLLPYFFFSSRRRHTRSLCDWSSDVCSSDLIVKHPKSVVTPHLGASTEEAQLRVALEIAQQVVAYLQTGEIVNSVNVPSVPRELRSEERRVGKECRCAWWREH